MILSLASHCSPCEVRVNTDNNNYLNQENKKESFFSKNFFQNQQTNKIKTQEIKNKSQNSNKEELKQSFIVAVCSKNLCDKSYADKTWDQGNNLKLEHRENFLKKIRIFLAYCKLKKTHEANDIFREIACFVNDKSLDSRLSDREQAQKEQFLAEKEENFDLVFH